MIFYDSKTAELFLLKIYIMGFIQKNSTEFLIKRSKNSVGIV